MNRNTQITISIKSIESIYDEQVNSYFEVYEQYYRSLLFQVELN